jgi:uncharacterized protein (TIGR00251 family)
VKPEKPQNPKEICTLKVRVQPKASRNQVDGFEDDTLRLRVTAPPTEGQANNGVIALLAKTLGVSKSRLEIVRGHSSRDKIISVQTLSEQEVRRRIETGAKS